MPHAGGTSQVVYHICSALLERGGTAVAWCANEAGRHVELPGVEFIPVTERHAATRLTGAYYPVWGPFSLLKLLRAVSRCDIVHVHYPNLFGGACALLFAMALGKRRVATIHSPPFTDTTGMSTFRAALRRANVRLSSWLLRRCDAVTAVSILISETAQALLHSRCITIPNGVDIDVFAPIDPSERAAVRERLRLPNARTLLLFVGRFSAQKGLDAIRGLATVRPEWRWVMVGNRIGAVDIDPRSWNLPNVIVREAVCDRRELARYYQSADACICLSQQKTEGLSLVLLEALACGIPPVTTNGNGYEDHLDGRLLSTVDDPSDTEECIAAIEKACAMDAGKFREEASPTMKEFDWKRRVVAYLEIYDGLMA